MALAYHRIIVKIGSNVLTQADGFPDLTRISHLVAQIADLKKQGKEIIVVSSGAVASGRSLVQVSEKADAVTSRQVLAAVGQVKLLATYAELLARQDLLCAQVLVTKEDFRDRQHYLNMQNCFRALLQNNIIPIVNENDVISVTELMFTDNDELAGLVATMLDADALLILSNVDGIFNGNPQDPASELIPEIAPTTTSFSSFVSTQRSQFGRGGMITKCHMAHKVAQLGISVHIANGKTENVLPRLLRREVVNTHFLPNKTASSKKKWIAHSDLAAKGAVLINAGAKTALLTPHQATSLLPVGVLAIMGTFQKGDIIRILDEAGKPLGLGLAEYGSDKALERLGQQQQKPLVHYDYLFLTAELG
ncbi:glutamate 5-kinase [Hymenobacter lutimineralis]|uniref:Glutamate 5-kinase n=1 Tax=Hymenobacter lutimineralis TaxID=2606448 RepID=A0A5D6UTK9_9BACT|nr:MULTISPECIES: glutamate 5-kinase [Hymenobacter]QIX62386.1 glutamate 5-kinase [Hymenobacter sp. BT18]TYZ06285.1 glutamate 5-kinase [Hymenobacter lutimineralis]